MTFSRWTLRLLPLLIAGFTTNFTATINAQEVTANPSTQLPERLVTLDTLDRWERELSNWGAGGYAVTARGELP